MKEWLSTEAWQLLLGCRRSRAESCLHQSSFQSAPGTSRAKAPSGSLTKTWEKRLTIWFKITTNQALNIIEMSYSLSSSQTPHNVQKRKVLRRILPVLCPLLVVTNVTHVPEYLCNTQITLAFIWQWWILFFVDDYHNGGYGDDLIRITLAWWWQWWLRCFADDYHSDYHNDYHCGC